MSWTARDRSSRPLSGNILESDYRDWGGETSEQPANTPRFKCGTSRIRRSIWFPLDLKMRCFTLVHYLLLSATDTNGENKICLRGVTKMISRNTDLTDRLPVFRLVKNGPITIPFVWHITLLQLVIGSRHFEATLCSHLQGSNCKKCLLKKRPLRCLETSGSYYQFEQLQIPGEQNGQLHLRESQN
jgi:hypothetical protein